MIRLHPRFTLTDTLVPYTALFRSLGDTIASAVSFAAAVSTEAALSAAFEATADETTRKQEAAREKRRHARQVRGTPAVPYFSFAPGLRRGSRSLDLRAVQRHDGALIYGMHQESVIALWLARTD